MFAVSGIMTFSEIIGYSEVLSKYFNGANLKYPITLKISPINVRIIVISNIAPILQYLAPSLASLAIFSGNNVVLLVKKDSKLLHALICNIVAISKRMIPIIKIVKGIGNRIRLPMKKIVIPIPTSPVVKIIIPIIPNMKEIITLERKLSRFLLFSITPADFISPNIKI